VSCLTKARRPGALGMCALPGVSSPPLAEIQPTNRHLCDLSAPVPAQGAGVQAVECAAISICLRWRAGGENVATACLKVNANNYDLVSFQKCSNLKKTKLTN